MRTQLFVKLIKGFNELKKGKFTRDDYVKTKGFTNQKVSQFIVFLKEVGVVKNQEPLIKIKDIREKKIIEVLSKV